MARNTSNTADPAAAAHAALAEAEAAYDAAQEAHDEAYDALEDAQSAPGRYQAAVRRALRGEGDMPERFDNLRNEVEIDEAIANERKAENALRRAEKAVAEAYRPVRLLQVPAAIERARAATTEAVEALQHLYELQVGSGRGIFADRVLFGVNARGVDILNGLPVLFEYYASGEEDPRLSPRQIRSGY